LDWVIEGKNIDNDVITLITNSNFCDLSNYNNRAKLWVKLTPSQKDKFISSSAIIILNNLLAGSIRPEAIESEITDRITSNAFVTKFLYENSSNIEPVITLFTSFTNLSDVYLSDYISNYHASISEKLAKLIGNLIVQRNFMKSARAIYEKSKYNLSFEPALAICKGLVNLNWFESIFGSIFSTKPNTKITLPSMPATHYEQKLRENLPTVVILTAIKEEYLAVRNHLMDIVDADRNDTVYEAGIFEFQKKEIAKVFIRECGPKNTTSSQETERAIQYFHPDVMLFVGIAGSRKPNDFSIGDVIFPEKVYSYEGGKSEKESFLVRPDVGEVTFTLKEIAKKERRKNNWKNLIKGNWNKDFNADIGIIASGEQVVEHYESGIGEILSKHYNDTSAIEMEGFGFASAAKRQGRETNKLLIGIVRGISDIIGQPSKMKSVAQQDRRPADAKLMASDTAAAFAFWLIFKLYENNS
jgi:nucleoside phosphorylase